MKSNALLQSTVNHQSSSTIYREMHTSWIGNGLCSFGN